MGNEEEQLEACKYFYEQNVPWPGGNAFYGNFKINMFYFMNTFFPVLFSSFNTGFIL